MWDIFPQAIASKTPKAIQAAVTVVGVLSELKRAQAVLVEHGEIKLITNQDEGKSLCLTSNTFGTGRDFASYQKRKVNTNLATNPLIYNGNLLHYTVMW